MRFLVQFSPNAERQLRKLPKEIQKRLLQKLEFYVGSPLPLAFAKSLVNLPPATHRFRVGKYRLCFYLHGTVLILSDIDTREDIYRR